MARFYFNNISIALVVQFIVVATIMVTLALMVGEPPGTFPLEWEEWSVSCSSLVLALTYAYVFWQGFYLHKELKK